MIQKIAKYTVRPEKVKLVEAAIAEFVAAIGRHEPGTSYAAWRAGETNKFVHLMTFPTAEAEDFHRRAPHTLQFVEVLYPNCIDEPMFEDLHLVARTAEKERRAEH